MELKLLKLKQNKNSELDENIEFFIEMYNQKIENADDDSQVECAVEHKETNPHCYWSGFHCFLADLDDDDISQILHNT